MSSSASKAGIGYIFANVLVRGIAFITLPIFSRLLAPDDFGTFNVFMAYDAMLFCIVGLAMHTCIKSANWEFPDQINQFVSSILILYIGNAIVLAALALAAGECLQGYLGLSPLELAILVVHAFGSAVIALYNARVSLEYSYKKYMIVASVSALGNVLLSLLLIFTLFYSWKYMGRILGATIAQSAVGIAIIVWAWAKVRPIVNTQYWAFALKYSLPIVPHGLSQTILTQFSRIMIGSLVSMTAAGIFSLVGNLMLIMNVLADSVSTVWSTWFYETMEGESANNVTTSNRLNRDKLALKKKPLQLKSSQLLTAFAIVAVVIMALAPEAIWVLGGSDYMEGAICAYGLVLSGFCVFTYNIIVVGEYYMQKTGFILLGTMVAAAVCIWLNVWWINSFGYWTAAYATLTSYVVYCAFHWLVSSKLLGFSIIKPSRFLLISVVLAIACVFCIIAISNALLRLAVGLVSSGILIGILVTEAGGWTNVFKALKRLRQS